MAINKKLITFDKKSTFLGANGINNVSSPTDGYYHNIPEWSMVFILETGEIWHNGKYFGKPIKDQIFPATSQQTKGIVFMNNDEYYYRSFNLWGNVFDGSVRDINGELVVQGEIYKWTYGDGVIRKGNTNLIAFSGQSGVYDVFIPSGNLSVTGGDLKVGNNITLASSGSIKGTHILNTNSYFNLDYSLGKTWNSIKQFNTSGTLISLDSTRPAIINIQAGVYASGTNWQPWITGGDVTEQSSWGIGLGGDAFYIGRISKTNTENSLSQYWKFDSEDGITISGTTKYIKVANLAGASEKIFLADGTVKALSELSDAVVREATTTNYGGFKLTQNKSSVQQTLVSNTTGNGRYAVKMNADGTLFVEFVQANTDKTGVKKGTAGSTDAGSALISVDSSTGIQFEGGTNSFKVGDGTKSINVSVNHGLSTKNITINGSTYALYTSASSLPTILAPTTLGIAGQILGTNGTTLEWKTLEKDAQYTATLSEVDLTTSWSNVDNLSTRLIENGSYIVQITYASCIYTGTFSYVQGGTVDDEIILHCSGTIDSVGGTNRGRLYAKIGTSSETTYLKLAVSQSESNANLSIKYRKLI